MAGSQQSGNPVKHYPGLTLAKQIAQEALRPLGNIDFTGIRYIPIQTLMTLWGIIEAPPDSNNTVRNSASGSDGLIRPINKQSNEQISFPFINELNHKVPEPKYEMEILDGKGTFRRRFTIAHEIAHVVLQSKFPTKLNELTDVNWESDVIDAAAGMIILPDALLLKYFSPKYAHMLNIKILEEAGTKMHVSISTLIKRLGDLSRSDLVRITNGALFISLGRAKRSGKDFAPRIAVTCLPSSWYIPSNKRLSSLGAESLGLYFSTAELYKERESEDHLTLWRRSSWSTCKIKVLLSYKNYSTEHGQRVMLAVIKEPRLDDLV